MVKRKKRRKAPIIAIIIIAACVVVLVISLYNIFRLQGEYKHSQEVNEKAVVAITEPAKDEGFVYDHEAALKINPDAKGMYRNDATETLLPIVQRKNDDSYYLHRGFDGEYSRSGTLFIAGEIAEGLDASHVIIYGHHMNDDSMFTKNNNYKDEAFYRHGTNDTFYIYTPDTLREYKIFAVYNTNPSGPVYTINMNEEELKEFAKECSERSIYQTGVDVSKVSQIVTLSSCEATDYSYRLVVQGVLVKETPYKKSVG